ESQLITETNRMAENSLAILIPAFNAAEFLPRLFRSIAAQTVPFEEIWVYDDGSTDNTAEVARRLGAQLVRGDVNRGCCYGKNVLISRTRCEWVHFHDADDELLPGFVAKAKSWISQDAHDVVLFGFEHRYEREPGNIESSSFDRSDLERDPLSFTIRNPINSVCGLYRRAAVLGAGGYDLNPRVLYHEDAAFHIRLAMAGLRFSCDEDVWVVINHRENSMWSSNKAKCRAAEYEVMRQTFESAVGPRYRSEISARLWTIAARAAS